jgi:outer membrane immunogenic protein
MKNRWLMGAAGAALTVAGAFAAQAADLPTRKEAPAPVFVPPPFTWTGFYVGLNAGGVWGTSGNAQTTVFANGFPIATFNGVPGTLANVWPGGGIGSGEGGFIGGGQAGYNWQTGAFVLGVETDFDWTSLSRSRTLIGPTFLDPVFLTQNDFLTANGSVRLDWLGSTRARVGFVATPDNRLMVYGTGGFAYGGASAHLNVFDQVDGFFWQSGSRSTTRTGWTLGAGVEYAFTNNWIIGAEYLYYNLGSRHIITAPNLAAANFFGSAVFSDTKVNFDGSVLRARVSYKF